jgi:hypothetical protein
MIQRRTSLDDLGYVEGRNLVIEYRNAEGKFARLPALVADPDVPPRRVPTSILRGFASLPSRY